MIEKEDYMFAASIVGVLILIIGTVWLVNAISPKTVDDKNVDSAWTSHGNGVTTKTVELEGHKYILMDGHYSGSIIHAESCSCKVAKQLDKFQKTSIICHVNQLKENTR